MAVNKYRVFGSLYLQKIIPSTTHANAHTLHTHKHSHTNTHTCAHSHNIVILAQAMLEAEVNFAQGGRCSQGGVLFTRWRLVLLQQCTLKYTTRRSSSTSRTDGYYHKEEHLFTRRAVRTLMQGKAHFYTAIRTPAHLNPDRTTIPCHSTYHQYLSGWLVCTQSESTFALMLPTVCCHPMDTSWVLHLT